jgi:uncharacterized RDD family membrane protein YckC
MPPPPNMPPNAPPPGYQPYQQQYQAQAEYGSWIGRVGASLIDSLVSGVFLVPAIIAIFAGPKELQSCPDSIDAVICEGPTSNTWLLAGVLAAIGAIAFLVMYSKKVGSSGQSWGHKVAGLRVVDAQSGAAIGTGRAFGRYLARVFSGFFCGLGFLWA